MKNTNDLKSDYSYEKLTNSKEINKFYKYLNIVFDHGEKDIDEEKKDISEDQVRDCIRMIKFDGVFIGYIGFSYFNQNRKKYIGLSNFMIIPKYQRIGHGSAVIRDIIEKNKDKYDEIYCWVSKDNVGGINFYKKIAKVDNHLTKYGYYVTLYKKKS